MARATSTRSAHFDGMVMNPMPQTPPDLDAFAAVAERALGMIPSALASHLGGLIIRVAEFAEDEVLLDLGIENPFELMGLYEGVSLADQDPTNPVAAVNQVWLYRRPILDYWCETGEDLTHVIRHVLIHEIGHHFGFSDADMEALEASATE